MNFIILRTLKKNGSNVTGYRFNNEQTLTNFRKKTMLQKYLNVNAEKILFWCRRH